MLHAHQLRILLGKPDLWWQTQCETGNSLSHISTQIPYLEVSHLPRVTLDGVDHLLLDAALCSGGTGGWTGGQGEDNSI